MREGLSHSVEAWDQIRDGISEKELILAVLIAPFDLVQESSSE
jgi:hypothetical protein